MSTQYTRLLQFSRQFGKFYAYQFAPFLERTGLSMREVHVLLFLINNPRCDTARDVADLRGLAKSQVSQAVELLSARGLLQRAADETDRRVIHLTLTEAGTVLAARAQRIQTACGGSLLEGLTSEEEKEFSRLLAKVFARAEQLMEKERAE